MGPAERYDMVIDFTGKAGKSFTLTERRALALPGRRRGGPAADHAVPGQAAAHPARSPAPHDARLGAAARSAARARQTRQLLLSEDDDPTTGDPIEGMLGTVAAGALHWSSPVTEDPKANSTEVWEFYNTTTDGHPIHVHLVRFQVLNRQKFDLNRFQSTGQIHFIAPPEAPGANERPAWKDVVKVFPGDPDNGVGSVTRVIQKFDLPNGASAVPHGGSPPTSGTATSSSTRTTT